MSTDNLTTPEPASAEVGAAISAHNARVKVIRSKFYDDLDELDIDPESTEGEKLMAEYESAISESVRKAIDESTATLRTELAKAKSAVTKCADALGSLRGETQFFGWEMWNGEGIDDKLESAYQSAIAASKEAK